MNQDPGVEANRLTPVHTSGRARRFLHRLVNGAQGLVKRFFRCLKDRYGPRYTKAMVLAAFIGLFLPLPGSSLVGVTFVAVVAEAHRAIFWRCGLAETGADRPGKTSQEPEYDPVRGWTQG